MISLKVSHRHCILTTNLTHTKQLHCQPTTHFLCSTMINAHYSHVNVVYN